MAYPSRHQLYMDERNKALMFHTTHGRQICIGDFLHIKPRYPERPLYVVKVENMLQDSNGQRTLSVRWFSRPSDITHAPPTPPKEQEIYHTTYIDSQRLESVVGHCQVLSMSDFFRLNVFEPEKNEGENKEFSAYVCEYSYSAQEGKFVQYVDDRHGLVDTFGQGQLPTPSTTPAAIPVSSLNTLLASSSARYCGLPNTRGTAAIAKEIAECLMDTERSIPKEIQSSCWSDCRMAWVLKAKESKTIKDVAAVLMDLAEGIRVPVNSKTTLTIRDHITWRRTVAGIHTYDLLNKYVMSFKKDVEKMTASSVCNKAIRGIQQDSSRLKRRLLSDCGTRKFLKLQDVQALDDVLNVQSVMSEGHGGQLPEVNFSFSGFASQDPINTCQVRPGEMYRFDRLTVPDDAPPDLKFVQVVFVSERTRLHVTARYPTVASLTTFFGKHQSSDSSEPEASVSTSSCMKETLIGTHPQLDGIYVMTLKIAETFLLDGVTCTEYLHQGHLWRFWVHEEPQIQDKCSTERFSESLGSGKEIYDERSAQLLQLTELLCDFQVQGDGISIKSSHELVACPRITEHEGSPLSQKIQTLGLEREEIIDKEPDTQKTVHQESVVQEITHEVEPGPGFDRVKLAAEALTQLIPESIQSDKSDTTAVDEDARTSPAEDNNEGPFRWGLRKRVSFGSRQNGLGSPNSSETPPRHCAQQEREGVRKIQLARDETSTAAKIMHDFMQTERPKRIGLQPQPDEKLTDREATTSKEQLSLDSERDRSVANALNPKHIRANILKLPKDMQGRWSSERYRAAQLKLIDIMHERGAVPGRPILRPALREEARKHIGDTGLLDHLLKHMTDTVVSNGGERFRRRHNSEGAMEYWLEDAYLLEFRKTMGVEDPAWIPPPGWKPGESLGLPGTGQYACACFGSGMPPAVASELKQLKEQFSFLKSTMESLAFRMMGSSDSSSSNRAIRRENTEQCFNGDGYPLINDDIQSSGGTAYTEKASCKCRTTDGFKEAEADKQQHAPEEKSRVRSCSSEIYLLQEELLQLKNSALSMAETLQHVTIFCGFSQEDKSQRDTDPRSTMAEMVTRSQDKSLDQPAIMSLVATSVQDLPLEQQTSVSLSFSSYSLPPSVARVSRNCSRPTATQVETPKILNPTGTSHLIQPLPASQVGFQVCRPHGSFLWPGARVSPRAIQPGSAPIRLEDIISPRGASANSTNKGGSSGRGRTFVGNVPDSGASAHVIFSMQPAHEKEFFKSPFPNQISPLQQTTPHTGSLAELYAQQRRHMPSASTESCKDQTSWGYGDNVFQRCKTPQQQGSKVPAKVISVNAPVSHSTNGLEILSAAAFRDNVATACAGDKLRRTQVELENQPRATILRPSAHPIVTPVSSGMFLYPHKSGIRTPPQEVNTVSTMRRCSIPIFGPSSGSWSSASAGLMCKSATRTQLASSEAPSMTATSSRPVSNLDAELARASNYMFQLMASQVGKQNQPLATLERQDAQQTLLQQTAKNQKKPLTMNASSQAMSTEISTERNSNKATPKVNCVAWLGLAPPS